MYKIIEELVTKVDERNSDGKISELIGVSIDKCFIKSVANTNGTDLSKYKVIRKNDFAVSLMQVSRDGKIPVARLEEYDEAIMSPAYPIFRVKDETVILPEYLEMWFKRPEFDREAAFIAVGGVRGSMPWEDFAKMKLPVPPIEKQRNIVKAYRTVTDRIALKLKINDNLLFQAKTWFSQFMSYISGTERLPVGWKPAKVGDFCKDNIANLSKADKFQTILYLDTGNITENYIDSLQELNPLIDEVPSRAKRKVQQGDIVYSTVRPNLKHYGLLHNPPHNLIVSTGFAVLHNVDMSVSNEYLYMWLTNNTVLEVLQSIAENSVSTYPSLNVNDLLNVEIIVPDGRTLSETNRVLHSIFEAIAENNRQIRVLNSSQSVLLSKLFSSR